MVELDPYKQLSESGKTKLANSLPKVAVIGSGISGMMCARLLAEQGYPVTVFEKEKEVGGRTSIMHEGALIFDHGCQHFTAKDRRFQIYVDAWVEKGIVHVWPARRASCLHGSVYSVEDDAILYVGSPGMNAISRHLGVGLDVRQDTIVSSIKRVNKKWKLLAGGKRETFDVVVVSAPAEQTAELLQSFPVIAKDAAKVETLPAWSIAVGFENNLKVNFDAAHFSSCPIVWAANNRSKPGRSRDECWIIQASNSWSKEHVSSPEDMVGKMLLSTFFEEAGIAPVTPSFIRRHRWYYGAPDKPLYKECLWDSETGVGACGDWCQGASLEGAFISGVSLAEKISGDFKNSK